MGHDLEKTVLNANSELCTRVIKNTFKTPTFQHLG